VIMKIRRQIPLFLLSVFVVVVGTPFGLDAGLTNLQAPLADRILTDDGDFAEVPIWKWANDITGDKAAIVLSKTGELDSFMLHRTWRRGQTVGQAVRAVEDYLGRFRVHFERETMTFISLSASELQMKTSGGSGYQGWVADEEDSGLSWKIAVFFGLTSTGVDGVADSKGFLAGGEVAAPLTSILDILIQFDYNGHDAPDEVDVGYYSVTSLVPGLLARLIPWQQAILTPYAQAGFGLSLKSMELTDGNTADDSSLCLLFGGGIRLGPPESFMIMLEAGLRVEDYATYFQLRGGLAIEL